MTISEEENVILREYLKLPNNDFRQRMQEHPDYIEKYNEIDWTFSKLSPRQESDYLHISASQEADYLHNCVFILECFKEHGLSYNKGKRYIVIDTEIACESEDEEKVRAYEAAIRLVELAPDKLYLGNLRISDYWTAASLGLAIGRNKSLSEIRIGGEFIAEHPEHASPDILWSKFINKNGNTPTISECETLRLLDVKNCIINNRNLKYYDVLDFINRSNLTELKYKPEGFIYPNGDDENPGIEEALRKNEKRIAGQETDAKIKAESERADRAIRNLEQQFNRIEQELKIKEETIKSELKNLTSRTENLEQNLGKIQEKLQNLFEVRFQELQNKARRYSNQIPFLEVYFINLYRKLSDASQTSSQIKSGFGDNHQTGFGEKMLRVFCAISESVPVIGNGLRAAGGGAIAVAHALDNNKFKNIIDNLGGNFHTATSLVIDIIEDIIDNIIENRSFSAELFVTEKSAASSANAHAGAILKKLRSTSKEPLSLGENTKTLSNLINAKIDIAAAQLEQAAGRGRTNTNASYGSSGIGLSLKSGSPTGSTHSTGSSEAEEAPPASQIVKARARNNAAIACCVVS